MKLATRDIILIGLFAALMVIGAFIKIPLPYVAVTFQLFFCIYAGLLLGSFKGALSQIIYVLLGLAGLPVFSEGGGAKYIFKTSFGFVLGFIVCAFVVGYITERLESISVFKLFGISLLGLILTYLIGDLYMYMILNYVLGVETLISVINGWMIPFMIKDLVLIVFIAASTRIILPVLRSAGYVSVGVTK